VFFNLQDFHASAGLFKALADVSDESAQGALTPSDDCLEHVVHEAAVDVGAVVGQV
jgi:hypothetical protein